MLIERPRAEQLAFACESNARLAALPRGALARSVPRDFLHVTQAGDIVVDTSKADEIEAVLNVALLVLDGRPDFHDDWRRCWAA
mmetsp:Transcript_28123/g.68354  ORF Transcript_28123/g.68354 Transcript_28123/m.68354 type:complete len:84 (-) Transcript_28123:392-643(-)